MSRVSKEQAARNRQAVVAAASSLIRQKGLDGVGVRELMASAGLTQGAFAKQFETKDALAAEACTFAFESAEQSLGAMSHGNALQLAEYYLSPKPPERACPMTTLAMDVARSSKDSAFREAYTDGLERLVELIAGNPVSKARLTLLAAMVGASILRKATGEYALMDQVEAAVLEFSRSID
ncbi:MAG: TetR/AcrR family transcriptional regulator [Gammaproteobacteria bacterium]|nr:TetR/AcrR family transcriptional regulator [Gammaproteobacteria bacterium]